MPMEEVQTGDSAGFRRLRSRVHAEGTLGDRGPRTQVTPAPEEIKRFPRFGLDADELLWNYKIRSAGMLGITWGSDEYGRFGSRGGRASVADIGGKEFGIDPRRVGGRVVVNLCRSNVWRHKIICVGVGKNSRRRRVGRRERARGHASGEELDEDTGEEGNEYVNQGELPLPGRVSNLLRGEQGLILVPIGGVVVLGIRPRLDVLGVSGVHAQGREQASSARSRGQTSFLQPVTMALPNLAARLIGERTQSLYLVPYAHPGAVPAGIAAALFQASIYDVPGGYRAVMFDRFSGVKDKVKSKVVII